MNGAASSRAGIAAAIRSLTSSRQPRHQAITTQTSQNAQNTSVTQTDSPRLEAAAAENRKMRAQSAGWLLWRMASGWHAGLVGRPPWVAAGPLAGFGVAPNTSNRPVI